jgi:hypothetical protein
MTIITIPLAATVEQQGTELLVTHFTEAWIKDDDNQIQTMANELATFIYNNCLGNFYTYLCKALNNLNGT